MLSSEDTLVTFVTYLLTYLLAGSGSILAMVQTASQRVPDVICGKPYQPMIDVIVAKYNIDPKKTLMIGDRSVVLHDTFTYLLFPQFRDRCCYFCYCFTLSYVTVEILTPMVARHVRLIYALVDNFQDGAIRMSPKIEGLAENWGLFSYYNILTFHISQLLSGLTFNVGSGLMCEKLICCFIGRVHSVA